MELILEFLDNSTPKKFLIPIKATALNALRIIYFKYELDINVDDLSELSLALISSNLHWKNVYWLDSSAILQNVTLNGLRHVFLLKRYFKINSDIQIAKTSSFLCSVLYSQFYKLFLSSVDPIDYPVLISLSAILLQCEFFDCEITLNSLRCNDKLSLILPSKYHHDSSVDSLIFNCWHDFKHYNEIESKCIFISELLSLTQLFYQHSYDVNFDTCSVLYISPLELRFTFPDSYQESTVFSLSSLTSLSFSLIYHSISCNFSDERICYFSDFIAQIVSIISEMVDISPVYLDDNYTDVSNSQFLLDMQFYEYLNFFNCEESYSACFSFNLVGISSRTLNLNLSKSLDNQTLFEVSTSIPVPKSVDLSYFDSHYDTLLLPENNHALMDFTHLSKPLTPMNTQPTQQISNGNFPDHLMVVSDISNDCDTYESSHLDFGENFYEHCNPIYAEASTSCLPNQYTYQQCFEDYEATLNKCFETNNDIIVPVSFSAISNLSSFGNFDGTYNDVHHLQIDSRLSNGLRLSLAQSLLRNSSNSNSTENSNIYMHSDSVFQPKTPSFSVCGRSNIFERIIPEFCNFASFHYIFYILLPSHELIQELVDIRDTPNVLLMNLAKLIGLSDILKNFRIIILSKAFDYSYQNKDNDRWNLNLKIQPIFDQILTSHHKSEIFDTLNPNLDYISQNIRGSMIIELSRISLDDQMVQKHISHHSNESLYLQCVISIIHGNVPISLQHSIEFAALQYQVYYLFRVSNIESSYCSPMEFISAEYKNIRGISKQILQEHDNLKTYTLSMTMDALIHKYMNLPQSQYVFFNVRTVGKTALKIPKLTHTYFGISLNGLMYVHPITKRILSTLEFNSLKRWKYTDEAFIYHIGLSDKVTALKTSQGDCISVIISCYIHQIIDNSVHLKNSSTLKFAGTNLDYIPALFPKKDGVMLELDDVYDTIL